MKIDKVFIINLKRRTDRKSFMMEQMKRWNISNYEFFEAIKPTLEEVLEWNKDYCSNESNIMGGVKGKFDRYRIGSLGCLKSHYEIIKESLKRGYKKILILEDDTMFLKSFDNVFIFSKQINNDFDMLYLSGMNKGKVKKISENLLEIEGTRTTGSYIINEKAMKFLKDNILGYKKEIDTFYAEELQPKLKCYCVTPQITKQKSSFSDIQGKFVRYKLH